jgi:hypothetical protein
MTGSLSLDLRTARKGCQAVQREGNEGKSCPEAPSMHPSHHAIADLNDSDLDEHT